MALKEVQDCVDSAGPLTAVHPEAVPETVSAPPSAPDAIQVTVGWAEPTVANPVPVRLSTAFPCASQVKSGASPVSVGSARTVNAFDEVEPPSGLLTEAA